jgi:hypothetical protein
VSFSLLSSIEELYLFIIGYLEGTDVNQVSEFKYLGFTVQENGGSEREIIKRIQCGWNSWKKVSGVLCDKKVPDKVKSKANSKKP